MKTPIQKMIESIQKRIDQLKGFNEISEKSEVFNEFESTMNRTRQIKISVLEIVLKNLIINLEEEKKQFIEFGDEAQRTDFYCKFQSMEEAFENKFETK